MPRDEHTTNRPTPGGSAFQETGMDDYLTRVAEAVRDACFEACNENGGDMGAICGIDMPAIIASVPRPEPVAAQPAVPDGWRELMRRVAGTLKQCEVDFTGSISSVLRDVEAMLAAEPVAAQPAVPDGWKVVPVKPSIAACIIVSNAAGGAIDGRQCAVVYRAMLAAAPEAPLVADDAATLREQNAEMLSALKAIDDLTGRAGFEFGGPLAAAIKEGLGDRGEFFELACIADGYFEAISKHTDNAIASAKGVRNEPCRA